LRLEQAGVKLFSMATFPLSGSWSWRGREGEMLWTAIDGSLDTGETLDHALAAVPEAKLLYVDPKLQRIKLPSQDASAYLVDGFLLIPSATPMANHCGTR
jgi:hypothetical protein